MPSPTSAVLWKRFALITILTLIVMSLYRAFFFIHFGTTETPSESLPAFILGARLDIKWLAIALWPAWLLLGIGFFVRPVLKVARVLFWLGVAFTVLLDLINIGFYQFYGTPISASIFGLFQDDTKAIIKTLWSDWPIGTYLGIYALSLIIPGVLGALSFRQKPLKPYEHGPSLKKRIGVLLIGTLIMVLASRGSISKFPLRQQDLNVSTNPFINTTIVNGPFALYRAYKVQKSLSLNPDPLHGLNELGFKGPTQAKQALVEANHALIQSNDNVVVAVMESMGRDIFDSNGSGNNTLGHLETALNRAQLFRQGFAAGGGTYHSLEGILFNTPVFPLMQSKYGQKTFSFSKVLPFKEAGYRVVFVTAGSESWRQLDQNLLKQGFDAVYGSSAILKMFPQAPQSTWGVPDEYMFKYAEKLLEQASEEHQKLFIVLLSITNHAPHHVPDGYTPAPVSVNALPAYVTTPRNDPSLEIQMKTYQYSANALGDFVETLAQKQLLQNTIVVASGDHNARLNYAHNYSHKSNGVPLIFWIPENILKQLPKPDTTRWVSHRDIFPTIKELTLGKPFLPSEGRNVFAPENDKPALAFYNLGDRGIAISKLGAVAIDTHYSDPKFATCYTWAGDTLQPAVPCPAELKAMRHRAQAEAGLADFVIRNDLFGQKP